MGKRAGWGKWTVEGAAVASLRVLWLLLPAVAAAQAPPDAGSLLRDSQREPTPRPPRAVPLAPPTAASASTGGPAFTVSNFQLQGATLVDEAQLQAALAPWLNRSIHFADLEQALSALAEVYRREGWLVRPLLPAQDMVGGEVRITLLEARLGDLLIDDAGQSLRFSRERLMQALTARQQTGQPLRPEALERAVNLLNDTPGLRAAAVLAAGRQPGQTDIVLKAIDTPRWAGRVQLDNESARASGATRLSGNAAFNSPSGIGDQVLLSAHATGAGNHYAALAYSLPLGSDGWRAGANVSRLAYRLGRDFAALDAHGSAQTLGGVASYPIWRSSQRSASFSLGLDRRDFVNKANGAVVSDKRLTSAYLGLAGELNDDAFGGGATLWGAQLASGRVDLSANAANEAADQAAARTAGRYARLAWNLARSQSLSARSLLWLSASGQQADSNLDSAEKFSLGGANGVRAYPNLEGSGDSGWLATAEWRYGVSPTLQWLVFYDHGKVRVNRDGGFTGASPIGVVELKGAGIGLNWAGWDRCTLRARVAQRIGSNPLANPLNGLDSDGSHPRTRVWLNLALGF